jgi:hypothetical protein
MADGTMLRRTTMPQYTPGPWRIGFEDGTGWMDDEDGAWIIGSEEEVVVAGGSHEGLKYGVPDEHNALLIAAAPELLEAAKRAYAFFELLAEKKAEETGETDVETCLEPEAVLLRDVLERAERPQVNRS